VKESTGGDRGICSTLRRTFAPRSERANRVCQCTCMGSPDLGRPHASRLSSYNPLYADYSAGIMLWHPSRCIVRLPLQNTSVCSKLTRHACSYALATPYLSSTRPWHASRASSPRCHQVAQTRGAKTQVTLNLDDIPQGVIKSKSLPVQDDGEPEYPPLLQQVRNNMLKFSHCVIVTRVGGFYEVCAWSEESYVLY
jgi:hypothetical protein